MHATDHSLRTISQSVSTVGKRLRFMSRVGVVPVFSFSVPEEAMPLEADEQKAFLRAASIDAAKGASHLDFDAIAASQVKALSRLRKNIF